MLAFISRTILTNTGQPVGPIDAATERDGEPLNSDLLYWGWSEEYQP